jgi:hypothetical protein
MLKMVAETIPGYNYGEPGVPPSPVSMTKLEQLKRQSMSIIMQAYDTVYILTGSHQTQVRCSTTRD